MERCIHIWMSLVSVSGWCFIADTCIQQIGTASTQQSILYTVCFFVPPVIFTPLLYLFTSLCSCVRTVINLLTWWAEYGKSVGGTETKCKEGQGARHYEMLCNL